MFTLLHNGIEKTLADWGLSNIQGDDNDLAAEIVTFIANGREVDAADLFPYGSTAEVFQDRSIAGGVFTGGKRCFYGRVEPWTREGTHAEENHFGRLVNPWWYLVRRTYQQRYQYTTDGVTFQTAQSNRVVLNILQDPVTRNLAKVTTGAQLRDVIQYCLDQGAPIQIGNIAPWASPPSDFVKNIKCDQVIRRMWDYEPDFVIVWDYSTMPFPTIHFLKGTAAQLDPSLTAPQKAALLLTPVTLDLNAGNLIEKIRITPRPDWKKSYVKIDYDQTNTVGDRQFLLLFSEWYSALGQGHSLQLEQTPLPADTESKFSGLDLYFDLVGGRTTVSNESTVLNSAPFNVTTKDQWAKWHNDLNSPSLSSATIVAVADGVHTAPAIITTEYDADGNPVAYNPENGYELLSQSGHYHDWLAGTPHFITAQKVRAIAWFRIVKKNSDDRYKLFTKDFLAISHNTGYADQTKAVTTTTVVSYAEPAVIGLAKVLWLAFQQNTVEGNLEITEPEVTNTITRANCLNFLSALQPDWAGVNALIRHRTWLLDRGTTSLEFGAPLHISANNLLDLLRAARNRITTIDMAGIFGGELGGGNQTVRHPRKEHSHSSEIITEPPAILGVSASNDPANEPVVSKRGQFSIDSGAGQILYHEYAAPPDGVVIATAVLPRFFNAAGPPSSSTLPAINAYQLRDRYTDETAKADYICTAAGTKITSAWAQISGAAQLTFRYGPTMELPAAPYPAVAAQVFYHVQPTHALVTTGLRDAANPTGPLVKTKPGMWQCIQAVPAQATVDGNPVWNVPVVNNPDNMDDLVNFWWYWGEIYC